MTSADISPLAEKAFLAGVESFLRNRRPIVDQNDIWLGLEPAETAAILRHFRSSGVSPDLGNVHVVSSADPEALGLRNRVGGSAPTLLVIIEERWDARSHDFGQSLHDLSRKQVSQLLADSVRYPAEQTWLDRASDETERQWIEALFDVLRAREARFAARDRDGQPMRLRMSAYFEYLVSTPFDDGHRADEALAEGLHRLRLFTHRALATEMPARRPAPAALRERLASAITQNYRAARDPDDFAAQLASRITSAESVLERYLAKGGRLRLVDSQETGARDALRAFLRGEVCDDVYSRVDWEFHEAATTRRGGKRRRHGVHGVLTDRDSTSEKKLRIVDAFVRKSPEGKQDETKLDIEAQVDALGRGVSADTARNYLRTRVHDVWAEPGDLREREQILAWIETLHTRARSREKQGIQAHTLLGGLLQCARRARQDGTPAAKWTIKFETTGSSLEVDFASTEWAHEAHRFLRQSVEALQRDEAVDDDGDESEDRYVVPIGVKAGSFSERIALLVPRHSDDRERIQHIRRSRLIVADAAVAAERTEAAAAAEVAISLPSLEGAKTPLTLSPRLVSLAELADRLPTETHPAGPFVTSDLRALVDGYIELLQGLPGSADPALEARRTLLQGKRRTLTRGTAEYRAVLEELDDLEVQLGEGVSAAIDPAELRDIARFQTLLPARVDDPASATRGPEVGWLMPFHPLVVRARMVEDLLKLRVLRALTDASRAMSERQLDFLGDALGEINQLEPCRMLGPWKQADRWPALTFQKFEDGFARFERARATRSAVGRTSILRALRDYVDVYPTSRDRLVLYLEADEDGRLAYDLATGLSFSGEEGESAVDAIDLRLAADADGQFPHLTARAALRAGVDESLFGIARGRLKPRVLFREEEIPTKGTAAQAHVAIVYAGRERKDHEPLLAARTDRHPLLESAPVDAYSIDALLTSPPVTIAGNALRAFSARDRVDQLWEQVQARVHFERDGEQFVHEVNLAPEQNGAALAALHAMSDWVILVSEMPVHRALAAGAGATESVRLIDRKRFFERGRAFHLCASTSHSQAIEELLAAALKRATGEHPASLSAMISFLQRFSPGLAMRYVGRPDGLGPEGVLGLLLTARAGESASPGSVAIPLDEHGWIFGRRGIHADVLVVSAVGDGISLRVLESKYLQDPQAATVRKARRQVEATSAALREWLELSEIDAYVRRRLHDAVMAHLADDDPRRALASALTRGAPIEISAVPEAHIWVWHSNSKRQDEVIEGVRTVVHSPEDTRTALQALTSAPF